MSATIRAYFALAYEKAGRTETFGSISAPVAELTAPGLQHIPSRHVTVPKGGVPTLLWNYQQQRDFAVLAIRLLNAGYLHCAFVVDTPEDPDAGDLSPSGDDPRARQFDLSCKVPFILNTDLARVNPVIGDDTGLDGNGVPLIFEDAGTEEGKVYAVWAFNPDPDNDRTVEISVLD